LPKCSERARRNITKVPGRSDSLALPVALWDGSPHQRRLPCVERRDRSSILRATGRRHRHGGRGAGPGQHPPPAGTSVSRPGWPVPGADSHAAPTAGGNAIRRAGLSCGGQRGYYLSRHPQPQTVSSYEGPDSTEALIIAGPPARERACLSKSPARLQNKTGPAGRERESLLLKPSVKWPVFII
jgi:hypothetical protein